MQEKYNYNIWIIFKCTQKGNEKLVLVAYSTLVTHSIYNLVLCFVYHFIHSFALLLCNTKSHMHICMNENDYHLSSLASTDKSSVEFTLSISSNNNPMFKSNERILMFVNYIISIPSLNKSHVNSTRTRQNAYYMRLGTNITINNYIFINYKCKFMKKMTHAIVISNMRNILRLINTWWVSRPRYSSKS